MAIESDFKVGQFGKIGEHMVGFELSKRGWIIFFPPYDERTDIVAMKFRCKQCKSHWLNEHRISCQNPECPEFEKPIRSINSGMTYKNKVCQNCGKMSQEKELKNWEIKNKDLVKKIEDFYTEYESANKKDFGKNEFKAHTKMLRISGRVYKKEIEEQVTELVKLNESFLTEISN